MFLTFSFINLKIVYEETSHVFSFEEENSVRIGAKFDFRQVLWVD